MAARKVTYKMDLSTGTLVQNIIDGREGKVFDALAFYGDAWGGMPEIGKRLALHGLKQKLADGHAAKDASPDVATDEIYQNLVDGNWSTRGEGGGERVSDFIAAYVYMRRNDHAYWQNSFGVGDDEAARISAFRSRVNDIEEGDDEKAKLSLRNAKKHPNVQARMVAIAEERLKARKAAMREANKGKEVGELGDI
ncbi:MAG TPA: hypothetical protein VNH84_10860 [Candidatus Saccharimonadales bacterium]|nr:hypothetical protein [Candidatus Saccharimonadales bacterium]